MDKNTKIAINATFTHESPTGLGVYTYELVKELLKAKTEFGFTIYSSSSQLKDLYPEHVTRITRYTSPDLGLKGHLIRLLWEQTILPLKLRTQEASLLYSAVSEGILSHHPKQIITVHDILPLKYPESCPKMRYYFYYSVPTLLNKSRAVICTSENTKQDIIAYHGMKDKPIYVIYAGLNRRRFYPRESGAIMDHYGLINYLLYIGDMRPYKNLERSLEAFALLNLKEYKFVIGGKKDPRFFPKVRKKVDALSLKDRVVFLDYVPEENLPHLYSEAAAFVFPSLYEGFGLPPLEAMACGCPVVVSNTASLPEVCGNAAYYVDPYDVENIAEGIYKVIMNQTLRQNLIKKGLERAKFFSWEKSAEEHLKVFREVLNS